jgi:DNA polymerase-1
VFFETHEIVSRKNATLRALPGVPETGWRAPAEFPNLSAASVIALDVETKETDWDHGPGWARGKSSIVGFSIAARGRAGEAGRWYFPIRHEVRPEENLEPASALAWLKANLSSDVPKVGANLIFDLGTLAACEGITAAGELIDVSFAQALLDEESPTALDHLAAVWLGERKRTDLLYEWCKAAYGGVADQRRNIWRAPPSLVGLYGEHDADLPIRIYARQRTALTEQGLLPLFQMECRSIRLLIRMRLAGVTVDLRRAHELSANFKHEMEMHENAIFDATGLRVNVNSQDDMSKLFDRIDIAYTRGANGKGSFRKEFIAGLAKDAETPPQARAVLGHAISIREYGKLVSTFINGYLIGGSTPIADWQDHATVHCSYHPLKSDDGGARTGRFASSDPNLQNIPARTKHGKMIRSAFVHDRGHLKWRKKDYSQIEYRMLAHFADGTTHIERVAADALRQSYVDDPKIDYHEKVYSQVAPLLGWEYPDPDQERKDMRRKPIKNVNFGLMYGQSEKGLAFKAGFTADQARQFFDAYHKGSPYVRATMKIIMQEVAREGFVTTIAGRRCRLNQWESGNRDERTGVPLPLDEALRRYGANITVWKAYRGTNYKLQGSAADVIKFAMVRAYDEGVFDVIGMPKLQVHDELDFSVIDDGAQQREAYRYLDHVLENSTSCRVPIFVATSEGDNWAEAA